MAANKVDQQALIEALEEIIQDLVKQGLIAPMNSKAEVHALAETVSNNLLSDPQISLHPSELKQNEIQQLLKLACLAEKNLGHRYDYLALFKNPNQQELKDSLRELVILQLEMTFQKHPELRPENREELEEKIDALVDRLSKRLDREEIDEPGTAFGMIATLIYKMGTDLIAQQKINLYGGQASQSAFTPSDDADITFGAASEGDDLSYAASKNPDFGRPDPFGILLTIIVGTISSGAVNPEFLNFETTLNEINQETTPKLSRDTKGNF